MIIAKQETKITPSKYQEAIYSAILDTDKNIVVTATAGSGKSHTLIESLKLLPHNKAILLTAFNRSTVEELSHRAPSHITCSTLHSIGMKALMSHFRTNLRLNEFKTFPFIEEVIKDKIEFKDGDKKAIMAYKFAIRDVVNLARMTMCENTIEGLSAVCLHYDINLLEEELIDVIKVLKRLDIYNRSLTRKYNFIDYIDMIYLPISNHKIKVPQFDFIAVDEAQDNNNCQHYFIQRLLAPKARTIYVGDFFQAIYAFMGSDVNSFQRLQERPNTISLKLSVSYRCSQDVVKIAQQICPEMEAYGNNEKGEVRFGTIDEIVEGDFVLSRNNRPLFYLYFKLLEQEKSVIILGKDIEVGLQVLISKIRKKTIDEGISYLQERLELLKEELKAKGVNKVKEHSSYTSLYDKIRTIEIVSYRYETMKEVSVAIEEMFKEKDKCVKLASVHHSKGMENDRVFVIERFNGQKMMPSPYAIMEWQKIQERNLLFVALTRAKKSLIFIQNINDND